MNFEKYAHHIYESQPCLPPKAARVANVKLKPLEAALTNFYPEWDFRGVDLSRH